MTEKKKEDSENRTVTSLDFYFNAIERRKNEGGMPLSLHYIIEDLCRNAGFPLDRQEVQDMFTESGIQGIRSKYSEMLNDARLVLFRKIFVPWETLMITGHSKIPFQFKANQLFPEDCGAVFSNFSSEYQSAIDACRTLLSSKADCPEIFAFQSVFMQLLKFEALTNNASDVEKMKETRKLMFTNMCKSLFV